MTSAPPKLNFKSNQGSNNLGDDNPTPMIKYYKEESIPSISTTAQSNTLQIPLRMTKAISFVLQADQRKA